MKHEPKYPNRHVGRLADHADHEGWTQTGHCVWCGCRFRLFNGQFPADATVDAKREVLEMLDAALDAAAAKRRDDEAQP